MNWQNHTNAIINRVRHTLFVFAILLLNPKDTIAAVEKQLPVASEILLEEAKQDYDSGNYNRALAKWNEAITINKRQPEIEKEQLASTLENMASVELLLGNSAAAIRYWKESIEMYRDEASIHLAALTLDLARAYNDFGLPQLAETKIKEAISLIERNSVSNNLDRTSFLKAVAFLTLGDTFTIQRNYERAIAAYQKSLAIQNSEESPLAISVLNALSKIYQMRADFYRQKASVAAREEYIEADKFANRARHNRFLAIKAAREAVGIQYDSQSLESVRAIIQLVKLNENSPNRFVLLLRAESILRSLPDSAQKIYLLIELSSLHQPLANLTTAIKLSEKLSHRVHSFALGALATYYEENSDYSRALFWNERAIRTAKLAQAPDIIYRWQWQAGKIYKSRGETQAASIAYEEAIAALQSIRRELANNEELAANFQFDIEPMYREYLELLLKKNNSRQNLIRVLEIRQLLQLSELENFFRDNCLSINATSDSKSQKTANAQTAVITTIILERETYIILQLPDGSLQARRISISKPNLEKIIRQWRYDLEQQENDNYILRSRQLYELLLAPIEADLVKYKIQKLTFVNDGILRNVPMSALHDGNNYLIFNYAIANSLGLDLSADVQPNFPTSDKALLFGLSEGVSEFSPLPYVDEELESISRLIPRTDSYLNHRFSLDNFVNRTESNRGNLIHIATHGTFAGTLSDSFLQAWNNKIALTELETVLSERNLNYDERIRLLFLSACETARGNEKATLGMSGVALRSGVETIIGSLWSLSDRQASLLVQKFYHYAIEDELPFDMALRQAQLDLISMLDNHPALWSSFTLIERS
ncbi:CHAT domain-containing protein [Myxosarcina sp. GI1]|uniref:CHAT domain-containing protein n=1 Tax=Myxosarcina sp. GI1 TaxID=1541065 RepID=UPI00056AE8DF|nr:CHAT domain-containing protein [Myxosarcina sp. GI1]